MVEACTYTVTKNKSCVVWYIDYYLSNSQRNQNKQISGGIDSYRFIKTHKINLLIIIYFICLIL